MNILFSPAHRCYSYKRRSEYSWSFNIVDRICRFHPESVIVTGFKEVPGNYKYRIIEVDKNNKEILQTSFSACKFNLLCFIKTVKLFLYRNKFDLIHHILPFSTKATFNLYFLLFPKKIPYIIGPIQSILLVEDKDYRKEDPTLRMNTQSNSLLDNLVMRFSGVFRVLVKRTLEKADVLVAVNSRSAQEIDEIVKNKKVVIIPPGIDIQKYKVSNRKKQNKIIEFVTASVLIKRKNVESLIKSFYEASRVNKNIRLRIIGDGPEMNSLKILVKKLNIQNYVLFEGYVEYAKMPTMYGNSDVFVSMTKAETWGQMYLEAMACGLPVITTVNDGSNEIIKDGVFGYLIEQDNQKAMTEKILLLAGNKSLIAKFGRKARKEVENKYDWDKVIIPKYLTLYKSLIDNKVRGYP